jgi:hypothetical protein
MLLRKCNSGTGKLAVLLHVLVATLWLNGQPAQIQNSGALQGVITDPSGAAVPGAVIQLSGPGGDRQARSSADGQYSFSGLRLANYRVRASAPGFSVNERAEVRVNGVTALDFRMVIAPQTQSETITSETSKVNTDTTSNGDALVLGQKELAALSDDPDELAAQLQAMAGPAAGPNGGQIFIDGFTGGSLPPKASIREVRINSNPFSPDFDRPGFGRIEIFTKPGTDHLRGSAFMQYNDDVLNSRSPLLLQSTRPPFQQKFYGLNLSGPILKNKISFAFDAEGRTVNENAFILATNLNAGLLPQTLSEGVVTPQTRVTLAPRIDYAINDKNTLVARYQYTGSELDGQGIGGFNLASQGYTQKQSENTLQLTETDILRPSMINEIRFQYMRSVSSDLGNNSLPAINVQGAFVGGGAQIGNSGNTSNHWEVTDTTSYAWRAHTFKLGGRLRQVFLDDTSVNNFGGTYLFFAGVGPALDRANQVVAGTSVALSPLEVYRRTVLFQSQGLSGAAIRALGGGASLFTISGGTPTTSVNRLDAGLFFNDDWRVRPNLSFSYGARYEAQTNISDWKDLSPRLSLAWGLDGHGNSPPKTVLRAGFGVFYDRLSETTTLNADRFNGTTQQSYIIQNPDFYPSIPSLGTLRGASQAQQLQPVDANFVAPRTYQSSIGLDRQINRYARLSARYINSRGVHLQRSRNINAPVDGIYPFGDQTVRLLTESTGFSRTNQLILTPTVNYKKMFLFGFYALSYGKDDNEGLPADPYNLRAEWGPSTFADVRHRVIIGSNIPLPFKFSVMPFLNASSGAPYNITTGLDPYGDGNTNQRPALVSGLNGNSCNGTSLIYEAGFGCFNLNPAPGTSIERNSARGPVNFGLNLRLSRSWSFGSIRELGMPSGFPPGGPPPGPPPGAGPGGPPGGGPGGGPPPGLFGGSLRRYSVQLSISANNILNHPSYATPSGDLTSPYFGQYRSLSSFGPGGTASTYDRKIDVQLRFTF